MHTSQPAKRRFCGWPKQIVLGMEPVWLFRSEWRGCRALRVCQLQGFPAGGGARCEDGAVLWSASGAVRSVDDVRGCGQGGHRVCARRVVLLPGGSLARCSLPRLDLDKGSRSREVWLTERAREFSSGWRT